MELFHRLISLLFPSRCIVCRQTVSGDAANEPIKNAPVYKLTVNEYIEVCSDCFSKLPLNETCCISCALPLPEGTENTLCGRCISKPPGFDYCYSLFRYEDDIIYLVHQLKFAEKISYARSLGEMLYLRLQAEIQRTGEKPDCLLPVPLHNKRLRQRGYNQSIEIARVIAGKLGIPIAYDIVKRERHTEAQSGLNARQRQKNIRSAFCVSGKVSCRHVLIVDDVVTTGATVNELARLLKKNRVKRVGVLSVARAPVK